MQTIGPHTIAALALLGSASLLSCDKSQPPSPEKEQPSATGSAASAQPQTGTVQASGSSALQPLVNAAKEQFETTHKGISIEVSAGGSKKGLADVAAGAVHIGDSDIFAPPDLAAQLVDHRVAVVGFAAMANKGLRSCHHPCRRVGGLPRHERVVRLARLGGGADPPGPLVSSRISGWDSCAALDREGPWGHDASVHRDT
jgi:hypothetical protein